MNQQINGYYNPPYVTPMQSTPRVQYPTPVAPVAQPQPMAQNTNPFQWVDGEVQAQSYLVAAGQTAVLWDSRQGANLIYIKSTDQNGIPQQMRVLRYEDVTGTNTAQNTATAGFVTMDEVTELMENKFEEMFEKKFAERRQSQQQRKKQKPRRPRNAEEEGDGYEE